MAKLNCPKCPDFDGFAMCTSQPLSKVASYEWCRKYLEGLEEVNGTITLSTDLFLRLLRKAYSDAKYYLVRPKGSKTVYIMDLKPEYNKGPFYKACEKNMSYLNTYCISLFRVPSPCENGYNSLFVIGLVPDEDSIAYIFDEPKENKMDLKKALASTDTYKVDNEVAIHYGLFDWHIPMLLINEPFKKYIQEHLDEFKVEESEALPVPGPTKESRDIPVISNRRLLI